MHLTRTGSLRLGIILTATGLLALIHRWVAATTRLPSGVELAVALVLVVVGIPFLWRGLRH